MKAPNFSSLQKLGYILRFYRRFKGLSQIDMASALEISHRNLQRLERGEVEPKLETLQHISKLLDLPISTLIRPTNQESLLIQELGTSIEINSYTELQKVHLQNNADLDLLQKIISLDASQRPNSSSSLFAHLDGCTALVSDNLKALAQTSSNTIKVDDYLVFGSCVERWELLFRSKLNQALITNSYSFPSGFKIFEEYHYNLNPDPEGPSTECYIKDVTARHDLANWLLVNKKRTQKAS